MEVLLTLFYLSGGLFLGFTLGANNMSSLFGTAVGTKMVSFKKAVCLACIFVFLGAVFGGKGTSQTLESLGSVSSLLGAFVVSFSAALTLFMMTKAGVPVSATQSIVGALLGWSLYAHTEVNVRVLSKIVGAWFISPLLAAVFAFIIMILLRAYLRRYPIRMLYQDAYTRLGLIIAGSFASYAFGANNIGNVMAPFLSVMSLPSLSLGFFVLSSVQVLFLIGAVAIGVGIATYSSKAIKTVGNGILKMSPTEAFVVVLAHGLVLVLFSSTLLRDFLVSCHLPSIPLVPISSSGAIVGAVVGVSLLKRCHGVSFREVFRVVRGWFLTPLIALILCWCQMFFMERVFLQNG